MRFEEGAVSCDVFLVCSRCSLREVATQRHLNDVGNGNMRPKGDSEGTWFWFFGSFVNI
jgi:hypothetical protein